MDLNVLKYLDRQYQHFLFYIDYVTHVTINSII